MKSICDITLAELMAEDLDVWVCRNKSFGFDLEIDDEKGNPLTYEKGIHHFATDSFADFCRRYLACYEKASNQEAA